MNAAQQEEYWSGWAAIISTDFRLISDVAANDNAEDDGDVGLLGEDFLSGMLSLY
jgi:hypothetical protein